MGADAYATGSHVVLGKGGASLHTQAHEAAHVLQQQQGVSLSGGVGKAGDVYERHADEVADAVVAGKSAEGIIGQITSGGSGANGGNTTIQRQEVKNTVPVGHDMKDDKNKSTRDGADPAVADGAAAQQGALARATSAYTVARLFRVESETLAPMLRSIANDAARLHASSRRADAAIDASNKSINFRDLGGAILNFGHVMGSLANAGKFVAGTLVPKITADASETLSGRLAHAFTLIDVGSGLFKNAAGSYAAVKSTKKATVKGAANAEMGAIQAVKDHVDESNAVASAGQANEAIRTLKKLGGYADLVRDDLASADAILTSAVPMPRGGQAVIFELLNAAAAALDDGGENILACGPEILAISAEAPQLAADNAPSRGLVEWIASDLTDGTKNTAKLRLISYTQKRLVLPKGDQEGQLVDGDAAFFVVPTHSEALGILSEDYVQLPIYKEPTFAIPDDLAALLVKVNCPPESKDGRIVEGSLSGRSTPLDWSIEEYMQDQESKDAMLRRRLNVHDSKEPM